MKRTRQALIATVAAAAMPALGADAPIIQAHNDFQNVVRLPDNTLWRLASRFLAVYYSYSTDNGLTWTGGFTAPYKLFDTGGGLNPAPTVGPDGRLHLFQVRSDGAGGLDLWHIQSDPTRTTWDPAVFIHNGRIGSMVKALTTSSGRLIAPFGDAGVDPPNGYGNNITRILYRDQGSTNFTTSPSELISPVPAGWNGASDGACEPTVIQKNDGTLWMLMRSQTGKLTESFSSDLGHTWTPAVNSNFYTTTGPPNAIRMDNGDMVMIWNNATMPLRHNNQIWYAGRDALHAAISQDDGQTWKGFREIYLDPFRNEDPVAGDTGTAYSFGAATADGKIVLITGQAAAKAQLRIDPNWLLETDQSDDFTGANPLNKWSVFKPYGDVVSVKRQRVQGAVLIDDPDPNRTKQVLHVRKPDEKDPDGAAWNFPSAARGKTDLRIKLQNGFAGGAIALTDRFFNPTDTQGESLAFYKLDIPASGILPGGFTLSTEQWYDISLDWKTSARGAIIRVDGQQVGTLSAQNGINVWPGLSYLRLRSTAGAVDTAGYLVDSVAHDGSGLRDAERMSAATSGAALTSAAGWTHVRMDDYVPNQNVTLLNLSGNGVTGSFASPFMGFVNGANGATPVGIIVESSSGTIDFSDNTSTMITSDLLGPKNGNTLTLRFVDPADPDFRATVSDIAFRLGSVAADNVEAIAFDADGNELPDFLFSKLASATNTSAGFTGQVDLQATSLIHSIQFKGLSSDTWLLGSFSLANDLNDLSYKNLQLIGSHWSNTGGGSWTSGGNWNGAIPNVPDDVAIFGDAITGAATISLTGSFPVGQMLFDNPNSYTLAGTGSITIDVQNIAQAKISARSGVHHILTPVHLADDAKVDVWAGASLQMLGGVSGDENLTKTGAGALGTGALDVSALHVTDGTVQLHAIAQLNDLDISGTGKLDLNGQAVIVDYTPPADPRADIRADLVTGRNGSTWNGNGIMSSSLAAGMGIGYAGASELGWNEFMGIDLDDHALVILQTFDGDNNLDGKVNTLDFNLLAGHFGESSAEWFDGDYDYDGDVDSVDFNAFAGNHGKSMAFASLALAAVVPEPSSLSLLAAATIFSHSRRARRPGRRRIA